MTRLVVLLAAVGVSVVVSAQAPAPPAARADDRLTQAQTVAVAEQALKNADNETGMRFLLGFGDLMQKEIGTRLDGPVFVIFSSESVAVRALGPVQQYLATFADLGKKAQPRDKIAWHDDVLIELMPLRLDSPDITKIAVVRGAQPIAFTANDLKVVDFSSPIGDKRQVRGGTIRFPLAAFDRGAVVTVTMTPETGASIVKPLTDTDLLKIR